MAKVTAEDIASAIENALDLLDEIQPDDAEDDEGEPIEVYRDPYDLEQLRVICAGVEFRVKVEVI